MAKSDGTQFLINIKSKYQNTVPIILEQLKTHREASDWVCQAILEKYAREQNSLEKQVEQMLRSEGMISKLTKPTSPKPVKQEPNPDTNHIKVNVNNKNVPYQEIDTPMASIPQTGETKEPSIEPQQVVVEEEPSYSPIDLQQDETIVSRTEPVSKFPPEEPKVQAEPSTTVPPISPVPSGTINKGKKRLLGGLINDN